MITSRGKASDPAPRTASGKDFWSGGLMLEDWTEGFSGSSDPVLDALIAFEERDGDAPFECFHYWHKVDWDDFPDCLHARRALVLASEDAERRMRGVPKRTYVPLKPINCANCQSVFHPTRARTKFCSKRCFEKAKHTLKEKPCKTCGKQFKREGSRSGGALYCSSKCYGSSKSKLFWELDGLRLSVSDWAKKLGLNRKTLTNRHRAGWAAERALAPNGLKATP